MRSSLLACALAASLANAQPYWQSITPAEAGFNTAKLETLQRDLTARKTSAFLIVRRGKIAYEWYAPGSGPEKRQGTASLAKALVGGLSLLDLIVAIIALRGVPTCYASDLFNRYLRLPARYHRYP